MGLSLYLDFGGRGLEYGFCFLGVGSVYLKLGFVWGGGGVGWYFFLRGFFLLKVIGSSFYESCEFTFVTWISA